ncbi:MAG: Eco57I restriction-modification methylase domain-containing protein [Lascolabacillus sp.]|nr:Eco57I restriction-modification methylase domain-containing protein [Lascolabacillus sp.]
MDRKRAIETIEQTFDHAFNKDSFYEFIQNLLNDIDTSKYAEYRGNLIKEAFRNHISQYTRLGKYVDPDGKALDVLVIEVKDEAKLDQARTSLRNFVINHLKTFEKDYALAAFYSQTDGGRNWRFSFIKLEHHTTVKDGKLKQTEELTPARRFSFLVGEDEKSHTAKRQLLPLLQNVYNNPLIEDLEKAFSIEVVTDEFFEQYKNLFVELSSHFDDDKQLKSILEEEGIDIPRFTKKLLGQVVFLYFLQKKGWLGVPKNEKWGNGQKDFIQQLYNKAVNENKNFFKEYLQYLFYEALARQHGADNYYERFNCRIPFLNGGLFEADYDWFRYDINIPNSLFRNEEKVKKTGDIGTGILDVFDRYNFTIREDEPLDKEVAVDPEMLGKVFENMLEIKERKSKGAFYTPREIVHYMCQESLIHYLDNGLNSDTSLVSKEDIEELVRKGIFALDNDIHVAGKGKETRTYKYHLPEKVLKNADEIDKLITEVKICDPAIGSGAFPVGLLTELVNLQLVLRNHLSDEYLLQKLSIIGLKEEEYLKNPEKYTYRVKRHSIQESIYGVDIDASAIDIARLRLWLSLVVDEEDFDNIEALPNLDYKIVCGNSLIGLPETAMRDLNLEKELEELKNIFFAENNEVKKRELRHQINGKIRELLDSAETFAGYKIDFDYKLYFSEVWNEKGGFDIVIGNPPYISISKVDYKNVLKLLNYFTYVTSGDLYTLFYEKGFKVLGEQGNLNFITSNKWINASYGNKMRDFFAQKTNPLLLIDFAKVRIFPNATVFVNILMLDKTKPSGVVNAVSVEGDKIPNIPLQNYFENRCVTIQIGDSVWKIGDEKELYINRKIEEKGIALKDWRNISFYRGITSGLNEAFHLSEDIAKGLIAKDHKNSEIIKPLLRGRDIKKWSYNYQHLYLINTHNGVKEKGIERIDVERDYPIIYNYLLQFYDEKSPKAILKPNGTYQTLKDRADQGEHWTNLRNCAFIEEFEKPKIIWIEISDQANFAYDINGYYLTNSAYFLSGDNLKYLIAVLNSSIFDYYFFQITAKIAGGRKRYTKQYVEQVPIPLLEDIKQRPYEVLVDFILLTKETSSNLVNMFFEQVLDSIVFELYFPDEIHAADKGILEHLQDLKPIDDSMSDEEKLAVVNSEFERLYDPYHPVRNNVETLDNVEVVRIIKEALRK